MTVRSCHESQIPKARPTNICEPLEIDDITQKGQCSSRADVELLRAEMPHGGGTLDPKGQRLTHTHSRTGSFACIAEDGKRCPTLAHNTTAKKENERMGRVPEWEQGDMQMWTDIIFWHREKNAACLQNENVLEETCFEHWKRSKIHVIDIVQELFKEIYHANGLNHI